MITVVIPTYNQGEFIGRSITSVLEQTYKDFELIIINGSSSDNTEEVIKCFKDPRIIYVKRPYCLMGDKLNLGFGMAKGKYLTWLASDDTYYPTFLMDMLLSLEVNPTKAFAYCDYDYSNKKTLGNATSWQGYDKLFKNNHIGIFWLFEKKVFDDVGEFINDSAEDYDYLLRIAEKGYEFLFVNKVLGCIGEHPNRASNMLDADKVRENIILKAKNRKTMI